MLIYHENSCDDWTAHATIVTYVSGSDIRITCHSVNRKNEPYTYMSASHPYYEWLHYPAQPTIYPLAGDLNANGKDSTGTYNTGTAEFTFGRKTVRFGQLNDKPIIGDWDGDGYDEIGLFRPSASMFYLVTRNWADLPPDVGAADKDIPFCYPEDIPIAGDWDGDGDDDIGGYYPGTFYLYLLNLGSSTATSYRDVPFGQAGDIPLIGDWDNDGDDDVAVCRKYDQHNNPTYYFDLDLTGGQHELGPYEYGNNDDIPIAGRWNAGSGDKIGVYRPSTEEFILNYDIPQNNPFCTAEYAVYHAGVPDPEGILNPLRELRDDNLKAEYVDRYYDYSPELTMVVTRDPALAYEAARLLTKYLLMIEQQVTGTGKVELITGRDGKDEEGSFFGRPSKGNVKLITGRDVEEVVSFTDGLKRSVLNSRSEIGATRSQEIIKFMDKFKGQINASEGKTFSEALQGSIYCEDKQIPDPDG